MLDAISDFILKDGRIKVYALLISFTFWLVILGQKDVTVSREVPVEYVVRPGTKVQNSIEKVVYTMSGKRSSINKFDPDKSAPVLDLSNLSLGPKRLPVSRDALSLPVGVKLLSIEPSVVSLYIIEADLSKEDSP